MSLAIIPDMLAFEFIKQGKGRLKVRRKMRGETHLCLIEKLDRNPDRTSQFPHDCRLSRERIQSTEKESGEIRNQEARPGEVMTARGKRYSGVITPKYPRDKKNLNDRGQISVCSGPLVEGKGQR